MRGCNEARPYREWGEQGFPLQRPSAESAKTRGASVSEPAALKVQLCAVPALRAVGVHKSPCVPSLGAGDSGSCSLSLGTNAASLAGRTLRAEHPGPRAESGRSPALAMFSSKPVLQQRDSLTDNQRATRRAQASGFPKTQSREV